jgi:curved DNA-binding protein CbpA
MTDYFALLKQPRRPWLDEAQLKQQFLALSSEAHPDRIHGATSEAKAAATQRFTELNTAFNCLKEPRDRVRHLVELELGRKPGDLKNVPGELADAFMKIATASLTTERLVGERAQIQSPLLQAGFLEKIQPHLVALEQLQREVARMHAVALGRLRSLDEAWQESSDHRTILLQLEELAQMLGFHGRWQAQLQEAHLRLTL